MLPFGVLCFAISGWFYENLGISLGGWILIPMIIIWAGSICSFTRKAYGLTITAAILSIVVGLFTMIIFGLIAILPLILLIIRREEFSR